MHNLKTVIIFEFLRTIKKKSFWLSVLAVPAVIAAIFAISYFSGKSATVANQKTNAEQFSFAVLDRSGLVKQTVLDAAGAKAADSREAGIAAVKSGNIDAFIYYPADPVTQPVEVYGKDAGLAKNDKYTALAQKLLKSSITADLNSPAEATILQKPPASRLITYINGEQAQGIEQVIVPGAFLVLFYLVIILLGNHMLISTTEEKENRVIEIILTSVDSVSLIIGKIMAMVLVGILQVAVMALPVVIGLLFFRDKLNFPQINLADISVDPYRLLIGAVIFIFSFLLFTGVLVTIGAVVPTAKEASGFFGIAMFFMFVPLYAVMAIVNDPAQTIVKVFSYFPMTAPITLMLRNAVGNLTGAEAAGGIAILAVTSIASLFIAARAFRYGTLEYEHKLSFKRIFKG